MIQNIQKVAVLGAGTMGSRIAAHVANSGLPCLLLDIVPKDAKPAQRNNIVRAGLEAAKKSKPAAFFAPRLAAKISIGPAQSPAYTTRYCGVTAGRPGLAPRARAMARAPTPIVTAAPSLMVRARVAAVRARARS